MLPSGALFPIQDHESWAYSWTAKSTITVDFNWISDTLFFSLLLGIDDSLLLGIDSLLLGIVYWYTSMYTSIDILTRIQGEELGLTVGVMNEHFRFFILS